MKLNVGYFGATYPEDFEQLEFETIEDFLKLHRGEIIEIELSGDDEIYVYIGDYNQGKKYE